MTKTVSIKVNIERQNKKGERALASLIITGNYDFNELAGIIQRLEKERELMLTLENAMTE